MKVKVGYEGDVDLVAAVRDAIGPRVALTVLSGIPPVGAASPAFGP